MSEVSPYKSLYEAGDIPVPGYMLVQYIGSGSFGQVWEAQGPGDVRVAIKVLNFGGAGQEREFKAIELVKKIRNPFLVPIFGIWLKDRTGQFVGEGSRPFSSPDELSVSSITRDTKWDNVNADTSTSETVFVGPGSVHDGSQSDSDAVQMIVAMGLGETSLHQRLKDLGGSGGFGIPGEKLLDYMEQVAQGIDFLNLQCGIIHRDIKPHNMLLVGDVAQVCDFGLAKRSDDIYNTVANMLTAAYCAPEAFDTESQPTPAMDQYALAVSYYELRTGKLPFASTTLTGVMKIKLTGKLLFDSVPPEEAGILARATAIDPQQRFASCREFIRALREQHSAAILPPPPPPPRSSVPPVRAAELPEQQTSQKTAHAPQMVSTSSLPPISRGHLLWLAGAATLGLAALFALLQGGLFSATPKQGTTGLRPGIETPPTPEEAKVLPEPGTPETTTKEVPKEDIPAAKPLPESVNSLGMKFLACPPGTFLMGSPEADIDASNNEKPPISIVIAKEFQLGKYEVTQAEWKRVMATEPWQGKEFVQTGDALAASYISWNDAIAFCKKLTDLERTSGALKTPEQYRLPSEAEWEYACRASSKTRFSFGDEARELKTFGWFGGTNRGGEVFKEQYPHAVGKKRENLWGFADMHGNVREWCEDVYQNKLSAKREPSAAANSALRVLRGGGWSDDALLCRSASRDWSSQASPAKSSGFRVVRELFGTPAAE